MDNINNKKKRIDIITEIIIAIYKNKDYFYKIPPSKRKLRTQFIKEIFVNLGHELGFKVYANGLSKDFCKNNLNFKNKEWLYDLQWYTEPKETNYQTEFFSLALECEWDIKRKSDLKINYSAVKYDFQKLLVSTAQNKVMIVKVTDKKLWETELAAYFTEAIKNYRQGTEANYLFFGFFQRKKDILLLRKYSSKKYSDYGHTVLGYGIDDTGETNFLTEPELR